jgi:hypothetical protein
MKTRCRKCDLEISTIEKKSFSDLEEKKNKLYASGNHSGASEVQSKLDFLYFGITRTNTE